MYNKIYSPLIFSIRIIFTNSYKYDIMSHQKSKILIFLTHFQI